MEHTWEKADRATTRLIDEKTRCEVPVYICGVCRLRKALIDGGASTIYFMPEGVADVEARATQASQTEGSTGADRSPLCSIRAHNAAKRFSDLQQQVLADVEARATQASQTEGSMGANRSVSMDNKEEMVRFMDELQKNLRGTQAERALDLLREAWSAAGSMMECKAEWAIMHAIRALAGETVDPAVPPMPSIPPWISPWEGEMSRVVFEKVGRSLEILSEYDWVRSLPGDPWQTLSAVHKWACEMYSKADHLEHNDRVDLERGREALGEAREYMREALHLLLRDDVTGDTALAYDRAIDAVGGALVVLSDNMLRDGRGPEVRPIRRVYSRREAALMAHAALSGWLRAVAEAPIGREGCRRRELPVEATAAMYRAAYLVGDCVMRDDTGRSPLSLARSAVGLVRERITKLARATVR